MFKEPVNVKTNLAWNLMENGFFSHYFQNAKIQVIEIRLEKQANEKVTKTKQLQTPINDVNIYLRIKITASLHISCLWSSGQKILPVTKSASRSEYDSGWLGSKTFGSPNFQVLVVTKQSLNLKTYTYFELFPLIFSCEKNNRTRIFKGQNG